jgi:3-hydroxyacyl-CoA dehydrogenase
LKWQAVLVGQGGSVQARLQTCFAACTKSLEQRGHAATDISAALASFGIGAALRGPVTPMPDQGAKIISAFCLAMANEGLRLIQEGIAKRSTDVDVLAVASGLYPRWQGGPMYWARALGLFGLRAQLRAQASLSGATEASLFTPVDLLDLWIRQDVSLPLMDDQPG